MTRQEFGGAMMYLTAACGKSLAAEASEVYFDLLGDLPIEALAIGVKRVALEHRWANFPSIAEIRAAAVATLQGQVNELSPAEAWRIAYGAADDIDLDVKNWRGRDGKIWASKAECIMAALPAPVREAMHVFGLRSLCCGKEPFGVIRAQFMKIYEQLQSRDRRAALFPAALTHSIAAGGRGALPAPIAGLLERIGAA